MNERRSGMESRVTELEIKLSLAEDQIEELNRTVFRQQQQMELLQAQIRELYQLQQPEAANEPRSLRDEIPPHY
jgi:SlyX protein